MDLKPEKVSDWSRLHDHDYDHGSESETTTTTTKSSPGSGLGLGLGSGPSSKQIKSCSDCQTTRTPLWRGGPAGPKSLCNACGIKYNKKRREQLGLEKNRIDKGKKKRKMSGGGGGGGGSSGGGRRGGGGGGGGIGQSLKMKLMGLGGEMVLTERSGKVLSTLREEEQAAVLLMALSCGSVYA